MFAQPTDSVKHLRKYRLWFLGQVEWLVLMFGFSTFKVFSIIFYMTRQMLAVSAESVLEELKTSSPLSVYKLVMNDCVLSEKSKCRGYPWNVICHLPRTPPCIFLKDLLLLKDPYLGKANCTLMRG